MTTKRTENRYCFDADALAMSWRLHYRPNSFEPLWKRIGEKIKDGSIIIPAEVGKEIGIGTDNLVSWLKQFRSYIIPVSEEQIKIVKEIVNKYPLVSQYKKPRPNHADPFVVAVGKIYGYTVVTYEAANGSKDHPKVPDLCKEYGVDCCSMADFFAREDLQFNIQ